MGRICVLCVILVAMGAMLPLFFIATTPAIRQAPSPAPAVSIAAQPKNNAPPLPVLEAPRHSNHSHIATMDQAWHRQAGTLRRFCDGLEPGSRRPVWPSSREEARCHCFFEKSWNESCQDLVSPFHDPSASGRGIYNTAQEWVAAHPSPRIDPTKPVIALLFSVVASPSEPWAGVADTLLFRVALKTVLV
jgi:hypothetical protein